MHIIGSRTFSTRKAAGDAVREILYRYNIGDMVSQSADEELLVGLIHLHADAAMKIGSGINHFEIQKVYNSRGFLLCRTDDSKTDFSYLKCLRTPTDDEVVRHALRAAIAYQIIEFKNRAFKGREQIECPISGDMVNKENCHVDHDHPSFISLADDYASLAGGYGAIRRKMSSCDGMIGQRIDDRDLVSQWEDFHFGKANLRIVSIRANLSLLRRRSS
jgi:hypothetical protein